MKIYLIRHGQTTGDVEDRYGGDYDDHLTEKGQRQSQELAQKLKGKDIEVVFSSPLIRAQETAKFVGDVLGCEVKTEPGVKERNFYGVLTGMIKLEAKEKHPEMVEALKNYDASIEGAEHYDDFKDRIIETFEKLSNQNYKTIAIISHGGPIHCFFREVVKKELSGLLADCAIIEMDYDNGEYEIINMNGAELK